MDQTSDQLFEGTPLLTHCKACGADISKVSLIGVITLPHAVPVGSFDRLSRLVPTGFQLVPKPVIIALSPQRCPECGHPNLYVKEQKVVSGAGVPTPPAS